MGSNLCSIIAPPEQCELLRKKASVYNTVSGECIEQSSAKNPLDAL